MSMQSDVYKQSTQDQPFPWLFQTGSIITTCPDDAWHKAKILEHVAHSFVTFKDSEILLEETNASRVFFNNDFSGRTYGDLATNILKKWEGRGEPSLACILYKASEKFCFNSQQRAAVLVAAMLGTDETGLAYHNAPHNRKVVLQAIRLAVAGDLKPDYAVKLFIGAAIHDLGHDGKGNMADGKHMPFRLEKQSFECARPYLKAAGLSDHDMDDIRAIILATDVSPLGTEHSPTWIVAKGTWNELPQELARLKDRPDLQRLARMLAVADVAPSAALSKEFSHLESGKIAAEFKGQNTATGFDLFSKAVAPAFDLSEARKVYGDTPDRVREGMPGYLQSLKS